jgi:V/A-type H+-transporting ATPase subunit D
MSTVRGLPPGRAGRTWLQHRLDLAHRAASRLDQKLRILRSEQAHTAQLLERTRTEWETRAREAEAWLLRAALLGGEPAVRPAPDQPLAEVTVSWTTSMGTRYPVEGVCVAPADDPRTRPAGSAAVIEATSAYRVALDAAVRHAVALAAAHAIDAEVARTRLRLRGVQDRWIPRLDAVLADLRLRLAEAEQAEGVRLRWAARQQRRAAP